MPVLLPSRHPELQVPLLQGSLTTPAELSPPRFVAMNIVQHTTSSQMLLLCCAQAHQRAQVAVHTKAEHMSDMHAPTTMAHDTAL